jgi:hypothetical protein
MPTLNGREGSRSGLPGEIRPAVDSPPRSPWLQTPLPLSRKCVGPDAIPGRRGGGGHGAPLRYGIATNGRPAVWQGALAAFAAVLPARAAARAGLAASADLARAAAAALARRPAPATAGAILAARADGRGRRPGKRSGRQQHGDRGTRRHNEEEIQWLIHGSILSKGLVRRSRLRRAAGADRHPVVHSAEPAKHVTRTMRSYSRRRRFLRAASLLSVAALWRLQICNRT